MKETMKAFKKIVFIDLLVGIIIATIIFIFFKNYVIVFLIGLILAIISFSINVLGIKCSFYLKGKNKEVITLVSLFLRSILVCVIALILIKQNKYYIFSYMLGYTCNFISLTLYGIII